MSYQRYCLVCNSSKCGHYSKAIADNIKHYLRENNIKDIKVVMTECFGLCKQGPIVKIMPDNIVYSGVKPMDTKEIVEKHLINGEVVSRLVHENKKSKQLKIVLRNCGFIDPENIDDYIEKDGYFALAKALKMSRMDVINEIKLSGLRGRGGGGFPTGLKWEYAYKQNSDQKYVVCNADEGDPGAFMDRSVLEGDPHSVIEGMLICGYAIGSNKGLVYTRAEYPLAVKRLSKAIKDAREYGFLGNNIMGSGFNFDIEIKYGAGAFVCGEETALIRSMEGERGEPTSKPPYPAESGYWDKPTNVNNVETFANVPVIINKGANWFNKIGTEKSKGTKVFALAGKINNVGLIEVPMGITLREIIFDIGGGIKDGKRFKAVQTGGPSGGCLTEKDLDTPIDYDTLLAKGSMMGSGGMIVMDEDDCMVAVAKFYLEFTVDESCGKCTPCRVGNKRLYELLEKVTSGKATFSDLDKIKNLSNVIKDTALCGLGQTAPNPVLSTITNFWDEYVAHVNEKSCPSGQCKELIRYIIDHNKCVGCTACVRVCPVYAISGKVREPHTIDQDKCIKCGACYNTCKFDAIYKK
ncbi:MAG TPA: NADH-quinone oxidoreductase subunit NuoF [Spirochaetota bacterium]|nr:NADH-quinone oxidoreductase subunit NuoF [Spirochaetota bacterium]HPQ49264.1 NADH-quinone oxidoreductase subunit NuoF [Spirochaetota bacterium]